jgi:hypothetical protein
MTRKTRYSTGGNTPANNLPLGASAAVRPGRSPGLDAASGAELSKRPGRSPGLDASKGATLAVRRAKGGPLKYFDEKDPAGVKRLDASKKMNDELGIPHYYKKGGHAIKKELNTLHKILHSHFAEGGEATPRKSFGGTLKNGLLLRGIIHKTGGEIKNTPHAKKGGKMWIQGAINPENKGALHRSLHVPEGQKIPSGKLHKAEHSKSPTLRKRAILAETLRGLNHRPRGR